MQPVTLKNNQYSNTLWLAQMGLVIVAVITFISGWKQPQLLAALPLMLFVWFKNHKTIKTQNSMVVSMRSDGRLIIADSFGQPREGDSVVDYWLLPHVMFLKLAGSDLTSPFYLTLFRNVVGTEQFAHIIIGVSAANTAERQP